MSDRDNIVRLTASGCASDSELAEKYRIEMLAALGVVSKIMGEAQRQKIEFQFSLGTDAFGNGTINFLKILKIL